MSYIKAILLNIIELFLLLFLITVMYYFNLINEKTFEILKLIILLFSIFINSFILGKNTKRKSYTLILSKIQIKLLIFYPLILITSILGSMIGSVKKNRSN